MPIWLIFAALVTVGVTALLVAVLYRINLPAERDKTGESD